MAIAVASVATTAINTALSGGNVNILKPTGLASGDLMVACIALGDDDATLPTNWTELTTANIHSGGNEFWNVFYKIADSSDASASSFNFATTGTPNYGGGVLYRITGAPAATPDLKGASASGTGAQATASVSLSLTPTVANSLAIMLVFTSDASLSGTISNYTLTGGTSPTFTERIDYEDAANNLDWSIADAVYTSATAVTAVGFDQVNGASIDTQSAALILIAPRIDGTGNHSIVVTNATCPAHANTSSTVPTSAMLDADCTVSSSEGSTYTVTQWTAQTKNDTTWTNQDK